MNTRRALAASLALCLSPALAAPERWTALPATGRPALAVMGDPGRSAFSTATPTVLRNLGYRVRLVWSVPPNDPLAQRLLPVLLIERQHFTREQYDALRTYVHHGGGLVLIGYAANWLDVNGNQRRDQTEPAITGAHGAGGLVDVVGAGRVAETFMLKELQPVAGDPLCLGLEAVTWATPAMAQGCNVVTLKPTTGTVACRMVRQRFDWAKGPGEVEDGLHDVVVHSEFGSGRALWLGWTGIASAARQDNAAARCLLRNAIAWAAQDVDLAVRPDDADPIESQLWSPTPGRFTRAVAPDTPPRSNSVETMLCHFTGRWHKLFGPPAVFAQWLAERHVEIIRVNVAACSVALYPSAVRAVDEWAPSKEFRESTGRDMLADLAAELHGRGIKLCGDYNHFSDRFRPGGDLGLPRAVDKDGQPSASFYCWLSPEFAQRTRELVTELFTRYELDALVLEDDHMPPCFCEPCLDGFRRFCEERNVACADPRQMDPKADAPMFRLFGRYRALRYYEQLVAPMREIIHQHRPGAKLGAWVGRWMRESRHGYSRAGLAPCVDFAWHMAYVDPPDVADDVWSDLANLSRYGTEQGAAMRPKGPAEYTIQGLTAALESGAYVIGVYPELIKTAADPGYQGMAHVFARAEAMWAERYERRLASLGHVVALCTERQLLPRERRLLLAQAGFDLREARLYDDGRRVSDLAPLLAGAHAVLAAQDVMLTDDDLAELERFTRAGGGLYLDPWALGTKPEFMAGDIVASSAERTDADAWLQRFGMALGDAVDVAWMSLRADHPALRGIGASAAVFGWCRRVTATAAALGTIGRDMASQAPVLCAGTLGKGRVLCFGGGSQDIWSTDLLPRLCRWLAGVEHISVTARRAAGVRAEAGFANTGDQPFAGTLGIALPRAAKALSVTVGAKPAEVVSTTTWGSMRYLYVPVEIKPGQSLQITVTADRQLGSD